MTDRCLSAGSLRPWHFTSTERTTNEPGELIRRRRRAAPIKIGNAQPFFLSITMHLPCLINLRETCIWSAPLQGRPSGISGEQAGRCGPLPFCQRVETHGHGPGLHGPDSGQTVARLPTGEVTVYVWWWWWWWVCVCVCVCVCGEGGGGGIKKPFS